MKVALFVCAALSAIPATAMAQQSMVQPPWLHQPATDVEAAVSRFGTCVSSEIRRIPASFATDQGQEQVLANCSTELAAVERQVTRIITESRLSDERKAVALRDLRERLAQVGDRVGDRIERRRARLQNS